MKINENPHLFSAGKSCRKRKSTKAHRRDTVCFQFYRRKRNDKVKIQKESRRFFGDPYV